MIALICRGEVWPIAKAKRVDNLAILPFITAFAKYSGCHPGCLRPCSAVLWTKYGVHVRDTAIMAVNGFGVLTSVFALAVYGRYMTGDRAIQSEKQLLLHFTVLFSFMLLLRLGAIPSTCLAFVACASSVLMYAAPLADMKTVLRTGEAAGLSPRLIAITFLVCLVWVVYGIRAHDAFVAVPSLIGSAIAAIQWGLMMHCRQLAEGKKDAAHSLRSRAPSAYERLAGSAVMDECDGSSDNKV